MLVKALILEPRVGFLRHYPYFNTPLIDMRQVLEAIQNFKISGTYFLDLNAVNQPWHVVRLYHSLFDMAGGSIVGIKALLFALDALTVLMQTALVAKRKYMRPLQLVLIFNPLSMLSPAVHNLGIVNHFLLTLCAYCILTLSFKSLLTDLACGLALYQDPTLLYLLLPIRLLSEPTFPSVLKSLIIWSKTSGSFLATGNMEGDLRTYWNIVAVKDHSETIGLFWYIFVELFKQHISFYRVLYLLFSGVLAAQLYLNLRLYQQYKDVVASTSLSGDDLIAANVTKLRKKLASNKVNRWGLLLSIYVSTYDHLTNTTAHGHLESVPLTLRPPAASFRPLSGTRARPQARGGPTDNPVRPRLLSAKHPLHVDYLGGPLLRQCELLLLPDYCLPTVPFRALHPALRRSRQGTQEAQATPQGLPASTALRRTG